MLYSQVTFLFQWREEDAEFAKEQARRSQEAKERRRKRNMLRRGRREVRPVQEEEEEEDEDGDDDDSGQGKGLDKKFKEASKKDEGGLSVALKSLFRCTTCSSLLPPPAPLYQVGFYIFVA